MSKEKKDESYDSLSSADLRKESERLQQLDYKIRDGITVKCPACKAKPNDPCKTSGGNPRDYTHDDRRRVDAVLEQLTEIRAAQTKIGRIVEARVKAKEESDRLEALNKQKAELSALVSKGIDQSLIVEYRHDNLLIVEANNIIIPSKYLKVNRESLELLLSLGVKIQMREPLPEPRRTYYEPPFMSYSPFRSSW